MPACAQVRVVIPPAAGSSQREPGYVMAQIREVITREPGTYRCALIAGQAELRPVTHSAKLHLSWAIGLDDLTGVKPRLIHADLRQHRQKA